MATANKVLKKAQKIGMMEKEALDRSRSPMRCSISSGQIEECTDS